MKTWLNKEVFKTLKAGDFISNKRDFKGGPAGYDYEIMEGYHIEDGEGCVKIRIIFGSSDKYKGQPYRFWESQIDECLGLYKKEL